MIIRDISGNIKIVNTSNFASIQEYYKFLFDNKYDYINSYKSSKNSNYKTSNHSLNNYSNLIIKNYILNNN